MKKLNTPVVMLCVLAFSGCATTRTLSVSKVNTSPAKFEQGVAVLASQKKHGVVVRLLTPEFSRETNSLPAFYVAFLNGGETPIDFSTANVIAESGSAPVKVFTYEQLAKRVKSEANRMAIAMAMSSASQSMAAAAPQTAYSSGTVQTYGRGAPSYGNYSGTTTTYNPAATAAAQAQINANSMAAMSAITASRDAQLAGMGDVLRRNTVAPGEIVGGIVKLDAVDIKPKSLLALVVKVSDEEHVFAFDVDRREP
jgi:hypothetical protein